MASKKSSSASLPALIEQFLNHHRIELASSPLTIRNYSHYLSRFISWLTEQKISSPRSEAGLNLSLISVDNIRKYRLYLSKLGDGRGGQLSQKTQGYHIIAIRSFLKWLNKNDYEVLAAEKLDLPKLRERQVAFLTGEQVDRLLAAPSMSSIVGKRDKAILELLFSTGLRVSELTKLNREQIDFGRREFGITGKGGRARVVFLSARAAEWISLYLAGRHDHYTPLFVRHKGKIDASVEDEKMRLTPRSVQRLVKKYSKKVKIPVEVTPHVLRHSFATDLLVAGADLRSVQEMLGHKNVATTQIYTHVTNKQLKDVHEKFHGKGK